VGQFIANDTHMGSNHGNMKLLTGPNASGKSVYLKQVAVLVYMAHIGVHEITSRRSYTQQDMKDKTSPSLQGVSSQPSTPRWVLQTVFCMWPRPSF
jgi:ABC-type cobalamin/Fe3+-siderophores transport system ATPase subunit